MACIKTASLYARTYYKLDVTYYHWDVCIFFNYEYDKYTVTSILQYFLLSNFLLFFGFNVPVQYLKFVVMYLNVKNLFKNTLILFFCRLQRHTACVICL